MATGPRGTRQKMQMQYHAQRRGTGLEVEREQFERNQYICITKAISAAEAPVKEKHVRSAIIGTFKEQGPNTFWTVVGTTLSLQSNPVICWKFCHTFHKILREGHANVVPESQKYRHRIYEVGEFWNLLRTGYGQLNKCYCRLLVTKLDFHMKNPRFPGNLQLAAGDLETIGERDVNNYFQLTVEMFDYMDDILALYTGIYNSLDMSRSNSMTTTGQCRLAPLIPCIQDSSQLYDYSVKILFKLHSSLPPDILVGHRDRFYKQYKILKDFYKQTSMMQYFKHLIQIPQLPDEPPNFLRVSDLSFHISPVVVLPPRPDTPESDSSSVVDIIVENTENLVDIDTNGSSSPDQLTEKDIFIECLQREIAELHRELNRIKHEDQRIIDDLRHQLMTLDGQMAEMQLNVIAYTKENTELQKKLRETAVHVGAAERLDEVERRAKANEEKFTKMRGAYNKLRDEHVSLLRSRAEVDKQFAAARKSFHESDRLKEEMEEKLRSAQNEKMALEGHMLVSANASKEEMLAVTKSNEALEETRKILADKILLLTSSNEGLLEKLQKAESDRSVIEEVMQQSSSESMRQLTMVSQAKEDLERAKQALEEKIAAANLQNQDLEAKLLKVDTEKCSVQDELRVSVAQVAQQLGLAHQLKEELERTKQTLEDRVSTVNSENEVLDSQVSLLKEQTSKLEIDVQEIRQEAQDNLQKAGLESLDRQKQLLDSCVRKAEEIIRTAIAEAEDPATSAITCPPEHLQSLIEPLLITIDKTVASHKSFTENPEDAHTLLENTMMFSHMMAHMVLQGRATSNGSPDIDSGDKLLLACKLAGTDSLELLAKIRASDNVEGKAVVVKQDVDNVNKLASALADAASKNTAEQVGDMMEDEMQQMDRAIEAAAQRIADLLNKSRKENHGVKLEVNEKVLDSCTDLMKAIRVLVQRSRDLQNEIVAQGRGSASVKEFYKRNHRWTEGFLSAAKSVGLGARFLVDAADKVVKGDGKFEVLMVASQEIAASTAQLVVASKVKADRTSTNLNKLSQASKQVTEATGNVVATAKSCAQLLEDSEVFDFSKLSLHQAKRLEMECQVHLLELENNLGKERVRLAGLRKQHYMLAGPGEGWEIEDIPK